MEEYITIRYLYNSGFTIEFADYFIVVDYYTGNLNLPEGKQILFIVTHNHADHYTPKIFSLPGAEKAKYVLSDDVEAPEAEDNILKITNPEQMKKAFNAQNVRRCGVNEQFEFAGIYFHTFGSTDAGLSILFEIDDVTFFHSGDLHAWKWEEFDEKTQEDEVNQFLRILEQVEEYDIDVGFGVVDGRLKDNAFVGPSLYLEHLAPAIFIPMHFREEISYPKRFKKEYQPKTVSRIIPLTETGESVVIEI